MTEIASSTIRTKLRGAATSIREMRLGFKAANIGTHLIHLRAAMTLFLAKEPTLTIMIIGRWRSDTFLRYILKQVAQFSLPLSSKMLNNEEIFHNSQLHKRHHMGIGDHSNKFHKYKWRPVVQGTIHTDYPVIQ